VTSFVIFLLRQAVILTKETDGRTPGSHVDWRLAGNNV
jgi:hypothetical protein